MAYVEHGGELYDGVGGYAAELLLDMDDVGGAVFEGDGFASVGVTACWVDEGECVRVCVVGGVCVVYFCVG